MRWVISPLVGAGPLLLGMTESEVANILDHDSPIAHRFVNHEDDSSMEGRGLDKVACHYQSGRLSGVVLTRFIDNVYFKGIEVFKFDPRAVLSAFSEENDYEGKFRFGNMVFPRIGINARGFCLGRNKYSSLSCNANEDERGIGIFYKDEFTGPLFDDFETIKFKRR